MGLSRRSGIGTASGRSPTAGRVPLDLWDIRSHCGASSGQMIVNNLIANPTAYATYYSDCRLAFLVTDPNDVPDMNYMQDDLEKARTIGIPTTMGTTMMANSVAIGGGAFTFLTGFLNRAQWQRNADYITAMIARFGSLITDNYLQLDLEAYGMTGVHSAPTTQALIDNGATIDDLRSAMQPFLRVVQQSGMIPYMYPADPTDVMIPLICGVVERAVVSDEVTFLASVAKRTCDDDYEDFLGGKCIERERTILAACGPNATNLPAVRDDILRLMGRDLRTDYYALGARRGWIYFRTNTDISQFGTAAYYDHTSLRSYNDAAFDWIWPNNYKGSIERTYGSAPESSVVGYVHSAAGGVIGPTPSKAYDDGGIRLDAPPGLDTHYAYHLSDVVGASLATTTFTIMGTFQIPVAQTGQTRPILGQSQANFAGWQLYLEANKLRIAHNLGGTQPRTTMLDPLPYDTDVRYILRRSGTTWSWIVNGGTLASVVANTVATLDRIMFGNGRDVSAFTASGSDLGCVGLLLKGHQVIWRRALSDADMSAAYTANTWPVGLQ